MPRKILVPMDGSPKSKAGLDHALTTYPEEDIVVLHVMTPYDDWSGEDPPLPHELADEWASQARAKADEILAEASAQAEANGVAISTTVDVGEAWRTIIDFARENDVDHIIMGSHGRADASDLPLGSVAETVMRRSPVLVSIVR